MLKKIEINEKYLKINKKEIEKIQIFNISFIFGKNGSGKTILSKKIYEELNNECDVFVFNKDYISKNIFIENINDNENNVKEFTTKNKKNTFEIFLGEKLIEINENINKNNLEIEQNKEWFNKKQSVNPINKEILKCEYNKDLKTITDINNFIKNKSFKKDWEKNNEEIKTLNEYKNYCDCVDLFNKIIEENNKKREISDLYNDVYNLYTKNIKFINFHKNAKENCVDGEIEFLEKTYKEKEIDDWLKKYENEKSKIIINFNTNKKELEKLIYYFNKLSKNFQNDELNEYKKNVKKIEENNLNEIKEGEKINIFSSKIDKWEYDSKEKINKISKWIDKNKINFLFKDNRSEAIEKIKLIEEKKRNIKILTKNKNEIIENSKLNLISNINNFIKELFGDDFDIEIEYGRGAQKNYLEIKSNKKNLEYLSEGEKNTLALAYFLTDLKINYEKIEKPFLIFIDDPFDSNDHFKYDNLSNIKIANNEPGIINFYNYLNQKGKKGKIIISTHNVNILSSLLRSVFEKNGNNNKNQSYEYCFKRINKDPNYNIGLFVLKKKNNISIIEELNKDLFFPIEHKLVTHLKDIFNNFIKEENYNNDKYLQIFTLLSAILTKLYNGLNGDERLQYKKYVKCFNYKKSEEKNSLIEKLEKLEIDFSFNEEEIQKFIEHFYKNQSFDPLIIKYLFFVKNGYQEILTSGDKEKIKRIRHKNNFYSLPIGHIIEE